MNNLRRAHIDRISAKLAELQDEIEVLLDLEKKALENLSESLQSSGRAQDMEDTIEFLEEEVDLFDDFICALGEAKGEEK